MLNLIKLELRRSKLSGYFWGSLALFASTFGIGLLFIFMPVLAKLSGETISASELEMLSGGWNNLTALLSTVSMAGFSVLSSVMYAKFVISEYTGKRVLLLFSYPVTRSRILWAKCSLVFWFTTAMAAVSNFAAVSLLGVLSNQFHLIAEPFTLQTAGQLFSVTLVFALLAGAIGLISMRVGFWKKSIPVTIVAAVILCSPFGNLTVALVGGGRQLVLLAAMLVLLAAGFCAFLGLARKVNRMEAL